MYVWVGIATVLAIGLFSYLARSAAARAAIETEKNWSSHDVHTVGLGVALAAAFSTSNAFASLAIGILIAALCVSMITDLRFGLIFDVVTLPAAILLAACAFAQHSIVAGLYGAGACAGVILILFLLSRGRGIGLGDLKLAACIGLALGVRYGVIALGLAFIAGGAHGAMLLSRGRAKRGDALRFAPYLALGSGLAIAASWLAV